MFEGKKIIQALIQTKEVSVQQVWETPQFNIAFQRFSQAITVAAEIITDKALFIRTKQHQWTSKENQRLQFNYCLFPVFKSAFFGCPLPNA
jgi:hypothetical protein